MEWAEETLRKNAERHHQHMPADTLDVAYIRRLLTIITLIPRNVTEVKENIVVTGDT